MASNKTPAIGHFDKPVPVAVGHARHNNKSIHCSCLNHSGGDNHRERAERNVASTLL